MPYYDTTPINKYINKLTESEWHYSIPLTSQFLKN